MIQGMATVEHNVPLNGSLLVTTGGPRQFANVGTITIDHSGLGGIEYRGYVAITTSNMIMMSATDNLQTNDVAVDENGYDLAFKKLLLDLQSQPDEETFDTSEEFLDWLSELEK